MHLKEAIQVLKSHNEWRRYDGEIDKTPEMQNPKEIGVAIDKVLETFKNSVTISKEEYEQLIKDSDDLSKVSFSM